MKKHGILLQKRVKSTMLLFIIQTKVNARLHMPGEEISIVYNVEDQEISIVYNVEDQDWV